MAPDKGAMEPGKRDRTGDACSKACRNGTRPSSQPARILATRQYTVVPAILGQSAQGGLSLALALATAWLTFSIPIFPAGSRFVVVGKISLESCTTSGCRYGIASCFKVQQQPILKGRIAYCQSVTITLQRPHVQFGKIGFRPRVPVNDQPSSVPERLRLPKLRRIRASTAPGVLVLSEPGTHWIWTPSANCSMIWKYSG